MKTQFSKIMVDVRRGRRGFALVVTLSLMVLLTVIAIGLLSLSAISLRGGSRAEAGSQARANARLALMLALGELQLHAGPDTRVTARADILDADDPPVLGVWRSWEGENHDSQGRPISPGNYARAKEDRFLGWMVSGADGKELPDTTEQRSSLTLLGVRTVGEGAGREKLQIHLAPEEIKASGAMGGYAWWVGGENQKARLPKPFTAEEDSTAEWAVISKSHAVVDPAPFRMDELLDDAAGAHKSVSLSQSDLVADADTLKVSQEFFHDLSTSSVGLLTNTATGGWRKDLSLMTENWNQLPNSNLPFFRLKPDRDVTATKSSAGNPYAARSILYPWAAYRGGGSEMPIYRHGAVSTWENLKDWATAYKRVTSSGTGRSRIATSSTPIDGSAYDFIHKVRVLPVVARIQWVFSHFSAPVSGALYEPRLLVTPVITMWNPYSVEITAPVMTFNLPKPLPVALKYIINGVPNPTFNSLTAGSTNHLPSMSVGGALNYQIPTAYTLKPGETRVFSPQARLVAEPPATLVLQAGYRGTGGHFFKVKGPGQPANAPPLTLPAGSTIQADATFDTIYNDLSVGVGIYMDMSINNTRHLAYRMVYKPEVAREVYQPLTQMAASSLSSVATTPAPFLSTVFGARMASRTHIPAKGFVQSSPLVNYTAMGGKDVVESTIGMHYTGTGHPVNSPFDYSFVKHSPGGDSQLPNASDTSGRGYIVTGFNKADGLSRCVIADLPTRPLLSLGELQGWDLRYENPVPPFAFNLIGNSDASPLIASNSVANGTSSVNLQHDDSYCANHLLFDDWFISSIAPDPTNFGASGRSLQQTFTDFLEGVEPLGNRAYLPIPQDAGESKASEIYNSEVRPATAYRTIASRLEVEGMFNVNSTSVTAWRALLGHARNQRVPHLQESGASWSVDLSADTDHAVSRFAIAGDVETSKQGSSGAFPEAAEFAGYRVFDEKMLDVLAEEIVEQVRARGPFLSLAEFVNRQLSTGELALAGAVQTALNRLAASSENPYDALEAVVGTAGRSSATPLRAGDAEYRFPAAAVGYNAYGLPGWTRQADILRPIAPILSARDDTFTIRAHGEARDASGAVVSRAVCEAVVRRTRDFVDPADDADTLVALKSAVNKRFGRRFEIESFRWLDPSEL